MKTSNITLGKDVFIDSSSTFNNTMMGDNDKSAKKFQYFRL